MTYYERTQLERLLEGFIPMRKDRELAASAVDAWLGDRELLLRLKKRKERSWEILKFHPSRGTADSQEGGRR